MFGGIFKGISKKFTVNKKVFHYISLHLHIWHFEQKCRDILFSSVKYTKVKIKNVYPLVASNIMTLLFNE